MECNCNKIIVNHADAHICKLCKIKFLENIVKDHVKNISGKPKRADICVCSSCLKIVIGDNENLSIRCQICGDCYCQQCHYQYFSKFIQQYIPIKQHCDKCWE